ncbi:saccharopine dehydrogenase C-terminal domain-containing protein [Fulvivirgaceae bacterium BMA10]|uniref:Saccharopine dehydrogenase C-terminal domain-containing protein n=1 Tax=Splendidivirga corallicola TaxID=3051826 RepID=A0ABT8KRG3_9BACT|nr:saccharopine dehydrogenase C-terminal domain-containing protein [Fulvivirgaceae bacterium BMA10]
MKRILILGAGRSATSLIKYLLNINNTYGWEVVVADFDIQLAKSKVQGYDNAYALTFDIFNEKQRNEEISKADIVISMLPASLHIHAAEACLEHSKNLLTASYVSDEIKTLDNDAKAKGLIFLMECGLDPGIDHMSAMRVINKIRKSGNKLTTFETFTGGLLAPESEEHNPWKYKFTWNPRNVVLAGQGTVKFIQEGRYKYIPYHRLFRRTEIVEIPEYGYFEGYANRDSLKYLEVYGLEDIETLYRGTFRRPGYCRAWDLFVQLGATEDSYYLEGVDKMTHRQFINSFLSYNPHDSVELKLAHYLHLDIDSEEMFKLRWLGVFEDELIGIEKGTPAQILEHILKKKWTIDEHDKDMIVMWHKFEYLENGQPKKIHSHSVVKGENAEDTAMAKTVGLPLGIAAELILKGEIKAKGVQIPIIEEIYDPILNGLAEAGVTFIEQEISVE